jgi:hypothetical protein
LLEIASFLLVAAKLWGVIYCSACYRYVLPSAFYAFINVLLVVRACKRFGAFKITLKQKKWGLAGEFSMMPRVRLYKGYLKTSYVEVVFHA